MSSKISAALTSIAWWGKS